MPDTDETCGCEEEAVTAAGTGVLRRNLTPGEMACGMDFAGHQRGWEQAVGLALHDWAQVSATWRNEIRHQLLAGSTADDLAALHVDSGNGSDLLYRRMLAAAQAAGNAQQRAAEQQGVTVPAWDLDGSVTAALTGRSLLRNTAQATADLLGNRLVQSARQKARALFGVFDSVRLAAEVDASLQQVSDAFAREQLGAAMTAAQAAGRLAVLRAAPKAEEYTSSEVLDKNACSPCSTEDGTVYHTLEDAEQAYPGGLFVGCLGGDRCRGTYYATWDQGITAAATEGAHVTVTVEEMGGKPNPGTKKDKRLKENPGMSAAATDCPPGWVPDPAGDGYVPADWKPGQTPPACPVGMVRDPDGDGCVMDTSASAGTQATETLASAPAAPAAAPDDATLPQDANTAPWEGVLAVEGVTTGDGREFAPDALTWRDLPIPLRWNKEDSHGGEPHTVAVNVGRIDTIQRVGGQLRGTGVFNLSEPDGQRAHDLVKGQFLRGVSIDADSIQDADIEMVWPADNAGDDGEPDLLEMMFAQPEKVVFHGGRISAATLCDIPAFAEAYVALTDSAGAVVAGGAMALEEWKEAAPVAVPRALVAHAAPKRAPLSWFQDPGLSLPTPITVTDDGRVYGHAAMWGSCHIGQTGQCVQPPREDYHGHYMTGEVAADDGTPVGVGQITVGTGHAALSVGAVAAAEHYDHTGFSVADVSVGNDAHGIWVAGAVRPGADPAKVAALRASGQVSGDWRRIGGKLRLVGLLAVNVPGFPVPRMRARVASGAQVALVAAGAPTMAPGLSETALDKQAMHRVMSIIARRVEKE